MFLLYDCFRRGLDPKLVPVEVSQLDNTLSMYNLVEVCVFCSQFFDPDFPDGIALPSFEEKIDKKEVMPR